MADKQPMSREAYRRQQTHARERSQLLHRHSTDAVKTNEFTEAKIKRLKRKLNWAIAIVVILIVLVYIILFKA
ncbi:MAG: hypothetical protein H9901_04675 [Candidatus Paralactobacillus gallistercoris]|uniref:Uncharacterized protein n=1 Tax=Candidatus Paralactobacillus gallistercoris TaxID=2838724 RepID=A0A948TJN9_9LACO|nr:hypothetical protein [Candidatus Paralactobacillus gallistercoris]